MALRQIKCPHCEHEVELDVTSVTESRECPNCGKPIVLQLSTKQKRARRTVLMVPSVDPVEKLGEAPHGDYSGPRALEGDVHDRMMHDPEVRRNIRRLAWGAGIVVVTIAVLCAAEYGHWWSVFDRAARPPIRETSTATPASVADQEKRQPVGPTAEPSQAPLAA